MRRLGVLIVLGFLIVSCNSAVVTPPPSVSPTASPSNGVPVESTEPTATPRPDMTPDTTDQAHDLLLKALSSAATAPNAHLTFTFDGSFDGGGLAEAGDVTGVTLEGDVNPQEQAASFHLSMPALDGLTMDIIVVDGTEYVRSSLGDNAWVKHPANGTLGEAVSLISAPALLETLEAALKDGRADITMSEATSFGDTPADAVTINVMLPAADDSAPFLAGMLGRTKDAAVKHWPASDETMKMPVTVFLDREDHSVIGLKLHFGGGENDVAIKGTVEFGDAPATITVPKGAIKGDDPLHPPSH